MNWRKFKKTELHRHLEGAIRLQTIIDVADEAGVKLPARTINELKPYALITEPAENLAVALNKFWLIQSCLATESILERITYENCVDAYDDGIRVLELRYSPGFINHNHDKLNFDSIHQSILKGARRAEKEFPDLVVGFICTISRDLPMKAAEESADFAIANKKTFVGFDLAGDEVAYDASLFAHLFKKVAKSGIGITVHSGEERRPDAPKHVKKAIDELGATRIGHGLQIIHDKEIIEYVKKKNVLLELCPSSNVLTRAVASAEVHPIKKLLEMGVKVSLNSDDPGFFDFDLTHEYELLERTHGFGEREFNLMNANALEFTFLDKSRARKAMS